MHFMNLIGLMFLYTFKLLSMHIGLKLFFKKANDVRIIGFFEFLFLLDYSHSANKVV